MERISNLKKNIREESEFEKRIQNQQKDSEEPSDARIRDPYKLDGLLAEDPAALSAYDLRKMNLGKSKLEIIKSLYEC